MSSKKKAIEIECPRCSTNFRVWVPGRLVASWEAGQQVGCIICRASLRVAMESGDFTVTLLEGGDNGNGNGDEGGVDRVLFVDDDKQIREMANDAFQNSNIVATMAKNSSEALKALESGTINLIVVDLHLKNPGDPHSTMDGVEFLWKVKGMNLSIPSIITTGKELIDDIMMDPKWIELNVKGFIQKGNPFWTDELKGKINELLFKD